jgi:hypothetical protein
METRAPGEMTVAILSDIHYAGPAERARGENYELRVIANPLLRAVARAYRHMIWMRHPFVQERQLERFLAEVENRPVDFLVANGDYSCDSAFVGVSDPAAFQSAQECLDKLREKFGDRAWFTIGDHELGKLTLFGGKGGMRLASWHCATRQLGLQPFWKFSIGRYLLIGVSSPLIALPANQPDVLPEEWPEWQRLREAHLAEIRAAFDGLQPEQRVLLFCHDPDRPALSVRARNRCAAGCVRWNKPFSDICTRASFYGKAGCCREFRPSGFWAGTSADSPRRCMRPITGGRSMCGFAPHCPASNC